MALQHSKVEPAAAAARVDGVLIRPGETFSFNRVSAAARAAGVRRRHAALQRRGAGRRRGWDLPARQPAALDVPARAADRRGALGAQLRPVPGHRRGCRGASAARSSTTVDLVVRTTPRRLPAAVRAWSVTSRAAPDRRPTRCTATGSSPAASSSCGTRDGCSAATRSGGPRTDRRTGDTVGEELVTRNCGSYLHADRASTSSTSEAARLSRRRCRAARSAAGLQHAQVLERVRGRTPRSRRSSPSARLSSRPSHARARQDAAPRASSGVSP